MKYLRLFGIKQNKRLTKVIIHDIRYWQVMDKITIDRPYDKKAYEVAEEHLKRCGFKIIGEINIPKYNTAYICEENPHSLVALTNEIKNKGELK